MFKILSIILIWNDLSPTYRAPLVFHAHPLPIVDCLSFVWVIKVNIVFLGSLSAYT